METLLMIIKAKFEDYSQLPEWVIDKILDEIRNELRDNYISVGDYDPV